jgi:hypothetical protein
MVAKMGFLWGSRIPRMRMDYLDHDGHERFVKDGLLAVIVDIVTS